MKKAFTLVELIVVIGIIGVLAGILMTSFSGGTESARAAKCLANMRNLAQITIGQAARSSNQRFPLAGSRAYIDADQNGSDGMIYGEQLGWISWLCKNDEYGTAGRKGGSSGKGGQNTKSFVSLKNASAYSSGDNDDAMFAITNGAVWRNANGNREIYVCPSHALAARKAGVTANWSYVMNAYFGYDWSDGQKAVAAKGAEGGLDIGTVSLTSSRLDRTLLFAELPFNDHDFDGSKIDTDFSTSAGNTACDCILQYKANYDGDKFNDKWNGQAESIAFNHKSGKRWCAHVAFADGHVEKMLLPKGSGGLNREQLTALLCGSDDRKGGKDIAFNGKTYTKLKDN